MVNAGNTVLVESLLKLSALNFIHRKPLNAGIIEFIVPLLFGCLCGLSVPIEHRAGGGLERSFNLLLSGPKVPRPPMLYKIPFCFSSYAFKWYLEFLVNIWESHKCHRKERTCIDRNYKNVTY